MLRSWLQSLLSQRLVSCSLRLHPHVHRCFDKLFFFGGGGGIDFGLSSSLKRRFGSLEMELLKNSCQGEEFFLKNSFWIYMWTRKMAILSWNIKGVRLYLLFNTRLLLFVGFLLANVSIWLGLYCRMLLWYTVDRSWGCFFVDRDIFQKSLFSKNIRVRVDMAQVIWSPVSTFMMSLWSESLVSGHSD